MPAPQPLPAELIEEGHTIPVARVQAMHEGKRRALCREEIRTRTERVYAGGERASLRFVEPTPDADWLFDAQRIVQALGAHRAKFAKALRGPLPFNTPIR